MKIIDSFQEARTQLLIDEDKKRDAQRHMAWFSLLGMLLYPFGVIFAEFFGLDKSATILGDMAPTYFVSVAAIVAAFYTKEHFSLKNLDYIENKKE